MDIERVSGMGSQPPYEEGGILEAEDVRDFEVWGTEVDTAAGVAVAAAVAPDTVAAAVAIVVVAADAAADDAVAAVAAGEFAGSGSDVEALADDSAHVEAAGESDLEEEVKNLGHH